MLKSWPIFNDCILCFLYEFMSSKPIRKFSGHFARGTNMAENTEFVWEYVVK